MKKIISLLIVTSFFITSSSYAYTILGSRTCGSVISSDRDNHEMNKLALSLWIKGYITGRNYELDRNVDINIDGDSLYYAAVKFCKDNPLKDNDDAVMHIYSNLKFE